MNNQSMTGFGRAEINAEDYQVTVEIKSVNNRFKDIRFKMPSIFMAKEIEFKEVLKGKFRRGSFDVFVNFKSLGKKNRLESIDFMKVDQYLGLFRDKGLNLAVNPVDFLKDDFLLDHELSKDETLASLVGNTLNEATEELLSSRLKEGEKLVKIISSHRKEYEENLKVITAHTSEFEQSIKDRLLKKFDEYKQDIPATEPRFMQEVIFYLEKMDISEEIDRINSHLNQLDKILEEKEVGRKIDFLVQELNRETNTIGSKSHLEKISNAVIQMKVHLEKIREQALNLE